MRSDHSPSFLSTIVVALVLGMGIVAIPAQATLPHPDHIVLVIEENHSYSEIIGNSGAPYINSLAQQGALFTHSFAASHPSEPNYLALFSGSTHKITDDSCPHTFYGSNLASELIDAGLTFDGYSESMPSVGYTGCTSGEYARKHNPWVNWQGINVPAADNLPFSLFPTDYTQLPTIAIVVPNLLDDMHDGTIQQGDTWLKQNLDAYVQWAKTHNSLLIVTWDEDDGSQSNQIPTLFVGPMVHPGKYSEYVNHYRVLWTMETIYALNKYVLHRPITDDPITDCWQ